MMHHDTSTAAAAPRRTKFLLIACGLALVFGVGVFIWKYGSLVERNLRQLSHNTELTQRKALLQRQLKELIEAEEEANLLALGRARSALFRNFETYASRIPQFAKEVAGFKNRLSIAAKSATDSANKTREAEKFVSEIFAKEVVTSQQMNKDIQKIIRQFQREIDANREILIVAAAHRIHEADLSDSQQELSEPALRVKILKQLADEKASMHDTPTGIAPDAYGGQGVAEDATQMLNAQIARVGASNLVLEVVIKAGTAVGLAVGLGIGYIADQWLSNRLQKKIIANTRKALMSIRDGVWNGVNGMKASMTDAIQRRRDISTAALDKVVASEI